MSNPRFSEYVRSNEWRCVVCGYINSVDEWKCGECACDMDSTPPLTETDLMARVVHNKGCDPADEAAVIIALMNVGYHAREIMENIEKVKLLAWAKRFKVSPERMGLFDGA